MERRQFITLLGSAVATGPLAAWAQQAGKVARVGFLGSASRSGLATRFDAFRAGLRELGYLEGANLIIDDRWADDRPDRLAELAAELAGAKVDVIVTHSTARSIAAKQATAVIPIVMAVVSDPVASGLAVSLARPGGNITGQSFFGPELAAKRIELLKDLVPQTAREAILLNPSNPVTEQDERAMNMMAQSLRVELRQFPVRTRGEIVAAFERMEQERIAALVIQDDPLLIDNVAAIVALASKGRLVSIGSPEFAQADGLAGYGVDFVAMYHQAATFVDKILKGVKPSDLPIEQATKFQLVINLKVAKGLGVNVSPDLLSIVNEVIE